MILNAQEAKADFVKAAQLDFIRCSIYEIDTEGIDLVVREVSLVHVGHSLQNLPNHLSDQSLGVFPRSDTV